MHSDQFIVVVQRWVRPAPKPLEERVSEGGDGHQDRDRLLAVPVHDFLEDEAVVEEVLHHLEEGRKNN